MEIDYTSAEDSQLAIEDLLGALQDLHHRLETIDDFDEYGVVESLISFIEDTLMRYDALD